MRTPYRRRSIRCRQISKIFATEYSHLRFPYKRFRHARQAWRRAKRRQAAALQNRLATRNWAKRVFVAARGALFLLTFYR